MHILGETVAVYITYYQQTNNFTPYGIISYPVRSVPNYYIRSVHKSEIIQTVHCLAVTDSANLIINIQKSNFLFLRMGKRCRKGYTICYTNVAHCLLCCFSSDICHCFYTPMTILGVHYTV